MTDNFRFRIVFSRHGVATFFSHLDAINAISRAIRRSGLPYQVTSGCHIRPKVVFGPPLPLGHSSRCEVLDVFLKSKMSDPEVTGLLKPQMPNGYSLMEVKEIPIGAPNLPPVCLIRYLIALKPSGDMAREKIISFLGNPETSFDSRKPGENKVFSLQTAVKEIKFENDDGGKRILVEFEQGRPGVPSISKITMALLEALGDLREEILDFERLEIIPTE